eukprot:CAMPEP_0172617426 /NCGR_PEP_ID=MMETSP1068-20121228/70244_1 /TAXON_ID=35684 /ORGANISM="Pseudopedinella elastica, Strain CCMP716" /LENGTH=251 /DNA_ID=CAMNT_0013423185 /DNA_START=319 /DNA_END=1074 /DNA_ORIENTATION=-
MWLDPDSTSTRSLGERRQRQRSSMKKKLKALTAALQAGPEVPGRQLEAEFVDVSDPKCTTEMVRSLVETADVVYVEGGNTFFLAHHLRRVQFKDAILGSKRNPVYVGISAGAIVAGGSIAPAKWKGWDKAIPEVDTSDPAQLEGLRLAEKGEVSFFPHFTEEWAELVEAKIAEELGKHTCVLLAEQREGDVDPDPAVPLTSKSPEGSEGPPTATKRLSPVTYWTSFQVSAGRKPAVYQKRPSPTPGIISRL